MNAISKLMDLNKFGIKLGLDNMYNLAELFNNPQNDYEIIHIAGTNGKGSTSVMTTEMLINAGFNVATYTSPYVNKLNENFKCNLVDISDEKLEELANLVISKMEENKINATHYEVCTMIMFLYAQSMNVDYLVLEVGLGGRYDATNIVNPCLSIITNVSFDHTELLGDTLEKIAYEKCGIIKNAPVIIGENISELIEVASSISSNIIYSFKNIVDVELDYKKFKTRVTIDNNKIEHNLFGYHQAYNLAIVYQISQVLDIEYKYFIQMTKNVAWPWRFEVKCNNPIIILDGAHNEAAMKQLKQIVEHYSKDDINLIFSMLKEKDVTKVAPQISDITNNVVITDLHSVEPNRAIDPQLLVNAIDVPNCQFIAKPFDAFNTISNKYKINLVCGSFKLLEEFERWYEDEFENR